MLWNDSNMDFSNIFSVSYSFSQPVIAWSLHLKIGFRSPGLSPTEPSHQPPFKFVLLVLRDEVLHCSFG